MKLITAKWTYNRLHLAPYVFKTIVSLKMIRQLQLFEQYYLDHMAINQEN